jgi:hypothetical protein
VGEEGTTTGETEDPGPPLASIPAFDSLPSARSVIYVDFDGERVRSPSWKEGNLIKAKPATVSGKSITAEQVLLICRAVAEDFVPVKISITTNPDRYRDAPVGRRMRVIVTPSKTWLGEYAPFAGGVASIDSFSRKYASEQDTDIPCWCFDQGTAQSIADTVTHEAGHTFGLAHDGTWMESYYEGRGSWGPIMGAPFSAGLSQWSKGEYFNADNDQDDIAILTGRKNGVGARADDCGNKRSTAKKLPGNGSINQRGLITYGTDSDWYCIKARKGQANFDVASTLAGFGGNLHFRLELYSSTGDRLKFAETTESTPTTTTDGNPVTTPTTGGNTAISFRLPKDGTYYVVVRGAGSGDPELTGFTSYGSLGSYLLKGTYLGK